MIKFKFRKLTLYRPIKNIHEKNGFCVNILKLTDTIINDVKILFGSFDICNIVVRCDLLV